MNIDFEGAARPNSHGTGQKHRSEPDNSSKCRKFLMAVPARKGQYKANWKVFTNESDLRIVFCVYHGVFGWLCQAGGENDGKTSSYIGLSALPYV